MDQTSSSSPPPPQMIPPALSIFSNTVSRSVLFFNKSSSSSSKSCNNQEDTMESALAKLASITKEYDEGASPLEEEEDSDSDEHSHTLAEFYMTAHSSAASSQTSLEALEEKSVENDSQEKTATTTTTTTASPPFTQIYRNTSTAFQRSLTFFEALGQHSCRPQSPPPPPPSSMDCSFLLPSIRYHSTAAAFSRAKAFSLCEVANHLQRKVMKTGFELTLMVIGESRLGKSTLINSIFRTDIFPAPLPPPPSPPPVWPTNDLLFPLKMELQKRGGGEEGFETTTVLLKEQNVDLHLTVVEVTPDFACRSSAAAAGASATSIANFIERRLAEHLHAFSQLHRPLVIADNRVHACLYLVPPSGLEADDVACLRKLHDKVSIIPVIAKADTLTPEELQQLKKSTMDLIDHSKIKLYDFPDWAQVEADHREQVRKIEAEAEEVKSKAVEEEAVKSEKQENQPDDGEEEGETTALNLSTETQPPTPPPPQPPSKPSLLAVIGSDEKQEREGKLVRVRKYPWGVVEVENPEHCDLSTLRRQLMHHLLDLNETTTDVFYYNYCLQEFKLHRELCEREAALETLQKNFDLELERLDEDNLKTLYQTEMNHGWFMEREDAQMLELEREIAQLKAEKRRLMREEEGQEEEDEEEGEDEDEKPPMVKQEVMFNAQQAQAPWLFTTPTREPYLKDNKNTNPKERIPLPKSLGGALKDFGTDIKRIGSLKAPKQLRQLFSPSSKDKRKTST